MEKTVKHDKKTLSPLRIQLSFHSELLLIWPYQPPDRLNSPLVSLMSGYDRAQQQ